MGAVALQAERPHIGKIAFAATLHNGHDVVCIPQALAAAHVPLRERRETGRSAKTFDAAQFRDTVQAANGADAPVALQHSFAQVAWIAAQLPLLNTPGGTEARAPGRDLKITPAAKSTTVLSLGQRGAVDPATRHGSLRTHVNRIQREAFYKADEFCATLAKQRFVL